MPLLLRPRPKILIPLVIVSFFVFQLYFFKSYKVDSINDLIPDKSSLDKISSYLPNSSDDDDDDEYGKDDKKVFVNGKNYIASPFENLLKIHGEKFHDLPYHQKCQSYFHQLYQTDTHWGITDFKELPYERYIFESKDQFIQGKVDEYKKKELDESLSNEEKDKLVKERNVRDKFELEWSKVVETSRITEQKLVDASTHLRVYGACFLDQFGKRNKLTAKQAKNQNINDQCHDIEVRMFPWLSRRLPQYKRWDGTKLSTMPILSDYIDQGLDLPLNYKKIDSKQEKHVSSCYMKNLRNSFNGKGITISAADKHLGQLISLFGTLRAIGNTLPIQIVHSGDLSEKTQEKLIKAARNLNDLDLSKIDNLNSAIKQKNIVLDHDGPFVLEQAQLEQLFPPQELWFVDVSGSISSDYVKKFEGYGNKLLAYFFTSFQHTILIDTDTVPVVDMEDFILKSSFYLDKGAYFFKDRELFKQNSRSDEIFYTKLMPSTADKALFNIPEITDFTLKNRFIGDRFAHLMESGVVAIDKIKHFTGVLATIETLLWAPAASKVWGDKELFWLGMSMAGDEKYYLNHWPAGSTGTITPRKRRLYDDKDDTRRSKLAGNELCSTHPAHLSSEDNSTLLWFNSGFTFCKFLDAAGDDHVKFPLTKNLFSSADKLKEMYDSYQKIESLIIPKPAEHYVENNVGENKRGWEKMDVCRGFIWCAYDKVGGKDDEDSAGLKIDFDQDTRNVYQFYGSVNQYSPRIFGLEDKKK